MSERCQIYAMTWWNRRKIKWQPTKEIKWNKQLAERLYVNTCNAHIIFPDKKVFLDYQKQNSESDLYVYIITIIYWKKA